MRLAFRMYFESGPVPERWIFVQTGRHPGTLKKRKPLPPLLKQGPDEINGELAPSFPGCGRKNGNPPVQSQPCGFFSVQPCKGNDFLNPVPFPEPFGGRCFPKASPDDVDGLETKKHPGIPVFFSFLAEHMVPGTGSRQTGWIGTACPIQHAGWNSPQSASGLPLLRRSAPGKKPDSILILLRYLPEICRTNRYPSFYSI